MGVALSLLLTWMCGLVGTASAADVARGKIEALLPPTPGAKACYARVYDADHLKRHPKQRVTEMVFFLHYMTFEEAQGSEEAYYQYWFTLAAKLRDKPQRLYASGVCSAEGPGCGVDGDGGGFDLEPQSNGALLVRLEREGGGFIVLSRPGGDGPEDDEVLEPGADDKVFKLLKAPQTTCATLEVAADGTEGEQ
jgi:hypothetical protein